MGEPEPAAELEPEVGAESGLELEPAFGPELRFPEGYKFGRAEQLAVFDWNRRVGLDTLESAFEIVVQKFPEWNQLAVRWVLRRERFRLNFLEERGLMVPLSMVGAVVGVQLVPRQRMSGFPRALFV